jgi:hypothetical protein
MKGTQVKPKSEVQNRGPAEPKSLFSLKKTRGRKWRGGLYPVPWIPSCKGILALGQWSCLNGHLGESEVIYFDHLH